MADTAIGLLQGDEPLPSERISELEYALQISAAMLTRLAYFWDLRDPRYEEISNAANEALRVLLVSAPFPQLARK